MKSKLSNFFYGRNGMDALSKFLFWLGLICIVLSFLIVNILSGLVNTIGIASLLLSIFRAFSRRREQRELENIVFLSFLNRKRKDFADFKDRYSQRKSYRFFRCPGCGTYVRVPVGKGKIHINCRCGYTMYRRT